MNATIKAAKETKLANEVNQADAYAYVEQRLSKPGGWREGVCGFRHKTGPFYLGFNEFSLLSILALLFEVIILIAGAFLPILTRKVYTSIAASNATTSVQPGSVLSLFTSGWVAYDFWLGTAGFVVVAAPKLLKFLKERKSVTPSSPSYALSKAVEYIPFSKTSKGVAEQQRSAINYALQAIQAELHRLIGDSKPTAISDVVLLAFSHGGTKMFAKCRTALNQNTGRERDAKCFMAYYVGLSAENYAEHDFLSKSNPFPKFRLTTKTPRNPITYRSVLFFPLLRSRQIKGSGGGAENSSEDCVGVVCVHSEKAYQFWRWGDQKKASGGFAKVAMEQCLPHLVLIDRLLGEDVQGVPLKSQ